MTISARIPFTLGASALVLALLGGCATPAGQQAVAELRPTTGSSASGSVRFVQSGAAVKVSGEIRGLKPNAEHGFHVHEKGDCLTRDESWVLEWAEYRRGREALKIIGRTFVALREFRLMMEPPAKDSERWRVDSDLRWCGFDVQLGNAQMSVGWLRHHADVRGFIVVPYLRANEPDCIWIVERGPAFETGMTQYLAEAGERAHEKF